MTARIGPTFYQSHGEWSDPVPFAADLDAIPKNVAAVIETVQGLFVHDQLGTRLYADPPANLSTASRETLPAKTRLSKVHAVRAIPLTAARDTFMRDVGTCRDFALLTCAILRHQGVPARVRCGFARYFHPPTYEDHWICQYWDAQQADWKIADAQLDAAHREHFSIPFDPRDVPTDQFMFPCQAWRQHRKDMGALHAFGHGDAKGACFVRVNLARDVLALAKHEVSAWDDWRNQTDAHKSFSPGAVQQCDELAACAHLLDGDPSMDQARADDLLARFGTPHWHK